MIESINNCVNELLCALQDVYAWLRGCLEVFVRLCVCVLMCLGLVRRGRGRQGDPVYPGPRLYSDLTLVSELFPS